MRSEADNIKQAYIALVLAQEKARGQEKKAAEDELEFHIKGILETAAGTESLLMPLRHQVRSPLHAACPFACAASETNEADVTNRSITLEELSKHTKKDDVWVSLNGQVLDVTKWVKFHPGGEMAIMTRAGTDVSSEWNALHSSGTLERAMKASIGPKAKGFLVEGSYGA